MRHCILYCLSLLSVSLYAETLFYKTDRSAISLAEHEILYGIMLEHQFPTCVLYGTYVNNELALINAKIQKSLSSSNIKATFIPTTLYELFCLNFVRENYDDIETASSGIFEHYGGERKALISYIADDIRPDEFKKANINSSLIKFHSILNSYIINTLRASNLSIPSSLDDSLLMLKSIDFWQPLKVGTNGLYYTKEGKNLLEPQDMKRAIEIEYHSYASNKYPIYRAGTILDEKESSREGYRSISFGSTLLGGIFFNKGACAYCYLTPISERPIGYAVLIDKKEYATGILSNMFYIPPLITILDLVARGEMFHVRTKVPDLVNVSSFDFQAGNETLRSVIPYYQISATILEEAEVIYQKVFTYIRSNHVILKK